ncbi:MAG: GIY-YIG nuclease family protein [bacterium]
MAKTKPPTYHLYILSCADGTLYTGITTDLARRITEHNSSDLGARYTCSRRPVTLRFSQTFPTRSAASKEELRIKKLSRKEKLELVDASKKLPRKRKKVA